MIPSALGVEDALTWEPMRFAPWGGAGRIPLAFWLVRAVRPRVLLSCGPLGNTYFAFCQAIAAGGQPIRAVAAAGDPSLPAAADEEAYNAARFADVSALVPADALAEAVEDGAVDLLHLHAAAAEVPAQAIARWAPKLSPRAVILIEGAAGDARLAPDAAFVFGGGDGAVLLAPGPERPPAIAALLDLDAGSAAAVREGFGRRGEALADRLRRIEAALPSCPPEPRPGRLAVALNVAVRTVLAEARDGAGRVLRAAPRLLPRHRLAAALRAPCVARREEEDVSLAVPFAFPMGKLEPPHAAAVCHVFHVGMMGEIVAHLLNVPFPIDIYVSTDTEAKRGELLRHLAGWPGGAVEVRVLPNRGRDIAPKLIGFRDVHLRYDYVLHLHSKRSAHTGFLAPWRTYLYQTLLGSPGVVRSIFEVFARMPQVGLVAPQHFEPIRRYIGWGLNFEITEGLARRMGIALRRDAALDYPAGSMFWARTAALRPLLDLDLSVEDFPEEAGQLDGTPAHAIERLYCLACEAAGFDWLKVADPVLLNDARAVIEAESAAAVAAAPETWRARLLSGRVTTRPLAQPFDRRVSAGLVARERSIASRCLAALSP